MSLQPAAEPLPSGIQPSSDRIRRAGTQVRADTPDGRSLAGANKFVGGGVDVGFGGSASYAGALLC